MNLRWITREGKRVFQFDELLDADVPSDGTFWQDVPEEKPEPMSDKFEIQFNPNPPGIPAVEVDRKWIGKKVHITITEVVE